MKTTWDVPAIANGILTWHMWPGFQGVHCRECNCEMNVMCMSYGHKCPDCDPDSKHYAMTSMHNNGRIPFKKPKFGPTEATLLQGGRLAMELSEDKRLYAVGTRVMTHGYWYRYGRSDHPIETGTVAEWAVEESYPGLRYYRVDIDGGQKFKLVNEADIAPLRQFADGETVCVRYRGNWVPDRGNWVPARIVRLVNDEESHFCYRQHWYQIELLAETGISAGGAAVASSMVHKLIFGGNIREEDIRPGANPGCRWCQGSGQVALATSTRECIDCWPG